MSVEYITTDDYINATRSPPLQPAHINYRSTETPPPLGDVNTDDESDITETEEGRADSWTSRTVKSRPQPSECDSFLIRLLGPNCCPEVAFKAGKELLPLSPNALWEDRKPSEALTERQMVYDYRGHAVRHTEEARVLAVAAFEASQVFNKALGQQVSPTPASVSITDGTDAPRQSGRLEYSAEMAMLVNGAQHDSFEQRYHASSPGHSSYHAHKQLNVKPPPRISLPSIRTNSPSPSADWSNEREKQSTGTSPTLAKYTISSVDRNLDHQLPRLQTSPSVAHHGSSVSSRQTLPSLGTALSSTFTSNEPAFSSCSSAITRPSPGGLSHFGPSPSTYSNLSPASGMSPPRVSTNPACWRTTSRDTSNSTPSEYNSAAPSADISTPASSAPGLSPANSANTPSTVLHDPERQIAEFMSGASNNGLAPNDTDSQFSDGYCSGSYKCTWPGCTAAPFQTQYLLNSHANVHSNTRPHFCPVHGCARGPGGQGFKRKNEMIRHGLVHQSPGYVCPFCPDQQHKYPRPDNLQRHVRVHHVDRDKDDPLLRDVLAQRPEGGNRGRRRRLGS